MRKLLLILALLVPGAAFGQGSHFQDVVFGSTGRPQSGAIVTVCSSSATGIPCTPTVNIFQNQPLTVVQSNPIISDSKGNFSFWAVAGTYTITITGTGVTPFSYTVVLPCINGATCNTAGNLPNTTLAFSATPTFIASTSASYTMTLTGNVTSSTVTGAPVNGTLLSLTLIEDATGGRTFTFPGNFIFPPSFSFSTTALAENALTFKFDGTNWRLISNSGGGGANPAGNNGDLQCKNSSNLAACGENDDGTNFAISREIISLGPNPLSDIRARGARAVSGSNVPPGWPGDTANCTATSASITSVSTPADFKTGDGVTLWGCGASITMSTPGTPTVTPSVAIGPTGTGMTAAAPAGATSFQYQIVAVDKNDGFTPAGTAGTTAAGNTLGAQSVSLTSCSKANNVVTCITSAPHGLVVNAAIEIADTSDSPNFGGFYRVATVPDNTHFTYTTKMDTRAGSTTSATGGTVNWFNCNHITWTAVTGAKIYLIYGPTAGSNTLIGISKVQNTGRGVDIVDPSWDDFGSTMNGSLSFLAGEFPNTPPVSGRPDSLTTTIASGGGTSTWTVANAAGNSQTGTTALLDDAPAMLAAATANGQLFVPFIAGSNAFHINSYLDLSGLTNGVLGITQQGTLRIGGTIELPRTAQWYGNVFGLNATNPAFANGGGASVQIITSVPGIFQGINNSTLKWSGINITSPNNSIGTVIDNSGGIIANNLAFADSGGADAMSMYVLARQVIFQGRWDNITMVAAQTGSSTTPVFFCNSCAVFWIKTINLAGRGIFDNGLQLVLDGGRKQGGTMPAVVRTALAGSGKVGGVTTDISTLRADSISYELDTDADPVVWAFIPSTSTGVATGSSLTITGGIPLPSADSGGNLPVISGDSSVYPTTVFPQTQIQNGITSSISNSIGGYGSGEGFGHPTYGVANASGFLAQFSPNTNVNVNGGNGLTIPFGVPTPTAAVTTTCTGFPSAGTYIYHLAVVGPDNVSSGPGFNSNAITLNGTTQCGLLTWTGTPGVIGYKVYLSKNNGASYFQPNAGGCANFNVVIAALTCTETTGTGNGINAGMNGTGNPSLYPGFLATNTIKVGSTATANFGVATISGNFTANRTLTLPDASGTFALNPVVAPAAIQSAYDAFNIANGSLSSNWTAGNGTWAVSSNTATPTTAAARNLAYWNANTFGNDQFSQMTIVTIGNHIGAAVRASGNNDYSCDENTTTMFLLKLTAGTESQLTSTGITGANGDVVRTEVSGNQLSCFQNGVLKIGPFTDNSFSSGSPGIYAFSNTTALDNWSGGNLHPLAQLDVESDVIQPWHFTRPLTVGVTNPIPGTLAAGSTYASGQGFFLGGVNLGNPLPTCTTSSGGMACLTEGNAPTNVAGVQSLFASSTTHELMAAMNGSSSFGMMARVQPGAINQTGQTAAITTATLCASAAGACGGAGQYKVSFNFWGSGTACSNVTAGSVTFLLTWTDENAVVHSAVALQMQAQTGAATTAVQASFPFQTVLANESASGEITISTNGNVIQYATGYTACTTGTGTYNLRASVMRVQ